MKDKIERPEVPGTCLSLRLLDGAPPARHAPRGHPAGGGARAPIRRVEPERTPLRRSARFATRPSARGAATTPNPRSRAPRPSTIPPGPDPSALTPLPPRARSPALPQTLRSATVATNRRWWVWRVSAAPTSSSSARRARSSAARAASPLRGALPPPRAPGQAPAPAQAGRGARLDRLLRRPSVRVARDPSSVVSPRRTLRRVPPHVRPDAPPRQLRRRHRRGPPRGLEPHRRGGARALAEVPVVPGDFLDPKFRGAAAANDAAREKVRKDAETAAAAAGADPTSCARREKAAAECHEVAPLRYAERDIVEDCAFVGSRSTRFDSPARWRPAMRSLPAPRPRVQDASRGDEASRGDRGEDRAQERAARGASRRRARRRRRRAAAERSPRSPRRRAPSRSNLASRDRAPPSPILSSRSPTAPSPALVAETLALWDLTHRTGVSSAPAVSVAAIQARVLAPNEVGRTDPPPRTLRSCATCAWR